MILCSHIKIYHFKQKQRYDCVRSTHDRVFRQLLFSIGLNRRCLVCVKRERENDKNKEDSVEKIDRKKARKDRKAQNVILPK